MITHFAHTLFHNQLSRRSIAGMAPGAHRLVPLPPSLQPPSRPRYRALPLLSPSPLLASSIFFFFLENKKSNPRKFSIFCPRSFQSGREKNLKNSPRKKIVPEKKTAKFNPRKKSLCPRKIFKVFPVKIEKIHWNSWISARERKQFIPRKNSKMCPRKLQTAREKLKKKWARKKNPPEKKTKKSTKKRFLGHFSFSRVKKKKTLVLLTPLPPGVTYKN